MESLLSLAFDNLSSYDATKVRKGLRQVDGLLAQICLSRGAKQQRTSVADKRRSAMVGVVPPAAVQTTTKPLGTLKEDPAFREFFKLQDGFEWNGSSGSSCSFLYFWAARTLGLRCVLKERNREMQELMKRG